VKNAIPPVPKKRHKRFDPHKLIGKIVVYGLAADEGIRILIWIITGIIHDVSPFVRHIIALWA
jgi:hypothetical protein